MMKTANIKHVTMVFTNPKDLSINLTINSIPNKMDSSKRNTKITLPEYKRKPNVSFESHADNASKTRRKKYR